MANRAHPGRDTSKRRVAIIGAGLCGSLLAALLREQFDVTLIEKGARPRPLFDDVTCADGEVNSSINRAEGLGGTTAFWHNALIEMTDADLLKAGIPEGALAAYYRQAWALFLSEDEFQECERIRARNERSLDGTSSTAAHMVLPRERANLWALSNRRHPGAEISVVRGTALRVEPGTNGTARQVVVDSGRGSSTIDADCVLVCGGGLSTPPLIARSLGEPGAFCHGYHDHPMAYVAKVRLRPDSRLKAISCTTTGTSEVRAGLVYESAGVKSVIYLRPALDLGLRSITGPARFILSDLRNDPLSPRKILALLRNLEAVREAILFKTKSGFRGDYYSILLLGEQTPLDARGLSLAPGATPALNWHISDAERRAYADGLTRFLQEFSEDIIDLRALPEPAWAFRTAAHHSGAAARFLDRPGHLGLEFFAARGLPDTFICDGSVLQSGGVANSGLTLAALSYRLAEVLSATYGQAQGAVS